MRVFKTIVQMSSMQDHTAGVTVKCDGTQKGRIQGGSEGRDWLWICLKSLKTYSKNKLYKQVLLGTTQTYKVIC